jgi:hypothetical protein
LIRPPPVIFWGSVLSLILYLSWALNKSRMKALSASSLVNRVVFYGGMALTLAVFLWGMAYFLIVRVLN